MMMIMMMFYIGFSKTCIFFIFISSENADKIHPIYTLCCCWFVFKSHANYLLKSCRKNYAILLKNINIRIRPPCVCRNSLTQLFIAHAWHDSIPMSIDVQGVVTQDVRRLPSNTSDFVVCCIVHISTTFMWRPAFTHSIFAYSFETSFFFIALQRKICVNKH